MACGKTALKPGVLTCGQMDIKLIKNLGFNGGGEWRGQRVKAENSMKGGFVRKAGNGKAAPNSDGLGCLAVGIAGQVCRCLEYGDIST